MTKRAIIRLAQIAADLDRAGRPHDADLVEDAMLRLSQSAAQNWWQGVKDVGTGLIDDAKAAGNSLSAPFEGAAAAASAAWNGGGLAYAPHAAGQAVTEAWDRANGDYAQEMQQYGKAAPALAGPGGTGLPGAVVQDALHGVGQTLDNAAQGYLNNALSQREQSKQESNMAVWLQQALQRHRVDGHGWDIINSAVQFGQLSPENVTKLKQEFRARTTWYVPTA